MLAIRLSDDYVKPGGPLVIFKIIVLYCIAGVVIAAQYAETFLRSVVLPRI